MRSIAFLFIVAAAAVAFRAYGGEAPFPPESTLDPNRTVAPLSRQTPAPSARVKVAIPSGGGQPVVSSLPAETPRRYGLVSGTEQAGQPANAAVSPVESWTSEPYSGMSGAPVPYGREDPGAAETKLETLLPQPLAMLDGAEITDRDVTRELWTRRGRETLDWMVGKMILQHELDRLKLTVTDEEIETACDRHMEGLARIFPGMVSRDDLARLASGMGFAEYRERTVWVELALRKIMRETLKPTDDQLRVYYAERKAAFVEPDRVRISQIFVPPAPGPDGDMTNSAAAWKEAERLILEAHTRLRMGEDFRAVASSYSSGSSSPRFVEPGDLLRELEDAAFSLRPGAVSAPIRTSMGYHIIRVEERHERKQPSFEEVRDRVLEEYENKFFVAAAGDFMSQLRENAVREGRLQFYNYPEPPSFIADHGAGEK